MEAPHGVAFALKRKRLFSHLSVNDEDLAIGGHHQYLRAAQRLAVRRYQDSGEVRASSIGTRAGPSRPRQDHPGLSREVAVFLDPDDVAVTDDVLNEIELALVTLGPVG